MQAIAVCWWSGLEQLTVGLRATAVPSHSVYFVNRVAYDAVYLCRSPYFFKGLRFNEYLGLCQQAFAAHDETRLRSYMKEYIDHKLISAKTVRGKEALDGQAGLFLRIAPLPATILTPRSTVMSFVVRGY